MSLSRLVLVLSWIQLRSWWMGVGAETPGTCEKPPCIWTVCEKQIGCVKPTNPFVLFGQNLTLDCILINLNQSSKLYFTWKNNTNISQEYQSVINPYTLQLNRPISESDDVNDGTLVNCYLTVNETGRLLVNSQFLSAEYPPRKVTSWGAVVNNWHNLSLTWDPGKYLVAKNVHITVLWKSADLEWMNCSFFSWASNPAICSLNDSVYNHSSSYSFNITVRQKKTHVTAETLITLEPDDYVKPAPVTSEKIHNTTSRCLSLLWQHDMEASKSLVYQVLTLHNNTEKSNTTTEQRATRICDLRPNMKYTFSVSARSARGGYWSSPVFVAVTMPEDKPDFGANITAGGFHAKECLNNKRNVAIFLKPPDREFQNGRLLNYTITYVASDDRPNMTSWWSITNVWKVVADLDCRIDYTVYLTVSTIVGSSPPSILHIPRHGLLSPPENVRVAVNGSSVTVQWRASTADHPISWTVLWCQGNSSTCYGPLDWMVVDGGESSSLVPLTKEMFSDSNYMFAVSMTTKEGSSGLRLQECLYDVNKGVDGNYKPSIQTVDSEPHLGLTVKWLLPVCVYGTLITNYIIQHCPLNYTDDCVDNKISSDHSEYVIPNLQEGVSYSLRLKEVALSGKEGQFSDPLYGIPKYLYLKPGWIGAIVIVTLIVIAIFAGVARWFCQKSKERYLIKMPHFLGLEESPPPLPDRQKNFIHREEGAEQDSGRGSGESSNLTNQRNGQKSNSGQPAHTSDPLQAATDEDTSGLTALTTLSCQDQSGVSISESAIERTGLNGNGCINDSYESDSPPYVIAGTVNEKPDQGCVSPPDVIAGTVKEKPDLGLVSPGVIAGTVKEKPDLDFVSPGVIAGTEKDKTHSSTADVKQTSTLQENDLKAVSSDSHKDQPIIQGDGDQGHQGETTTEILTLASNGQSLSPQQHTENSSTLSSSYV